jgi:hypothetical protein
VPKEAGWPSRNNVCDLKRSFSWLSESRVTVTNVCDATGEGLTTIQKKKTINAVVLRNYPSF